MPQLDPAPWFLTLVFSWVVFLTIIPAKVLGHTFPNEPSPQATQETKTQPWAWPWQ
uniref:ATP synthase complex subunit 8 n=1 Tax=Cyclopsetta fimbriata TaxID=721932 RepID=A0A090ARA1_9PLEU|nr:ATP synthase F0 subunit 8 [Cyclopsetta fimbriata]BAP58942.1 ATPase subunit 8 [Cyclopsetta fimbriata]